MGILLLFMNSFCCDNEFPLRDLSLGELAGGSLGAFTEAVLETARQVLHVLHAASAGSLSSDGLLTPLVAADLSRRVATARAGFLLNVVRAAAATPAQSVRLVVALSERLSTLGH